VANEVLSQILKIFYYALTIFQPTIKLLSR